MTYEELVRLAIVFELLAYFAVAVVVVFAMFRLMVKAFRAIIRKQQGPIEKLQEYDIEISRNNKMRVIQRDKDQ